MPGFELIGEEEKQALMALFDEGGVLFAHGFDGRRKHYHVREFEAELARATGSRHALCLSSGTAAIKVALKALGVGPGDEVITQSFNFIADFEAIVDCGATPVAAGSDDTLNMDPAQLEALITPRTRAIMPVHMLGVPANMDAILEVAARHGLPVIEDACEAVGATYDGKAAGTLGAMGMFSFDFGKTITTGEGGVLLIQDDDLAEKARMYHDHGHMNLKGVPRGLDRAGMSGFNYRMSEMNAVVGKVQLSKLPVIIEETAARYAALDRAMQSPEFTKRTIPAKAVPAWDTYIMEVPDEALREQVITLLGETGFGTKNLPDAMNWHCSAYWDHMGFNNESSAALETKSTLLRQVSIPVMLGRSVEEYARLGEQIARLAAG